MAAPSSWPHLNLITSWRAPPPNSILGLRHSTGILQGHWHSTRTEGLGTLKLLSHFPFTSTQKTTPAWTPVNEALCSSFDGSIHATILFWAFARIQWGYPCAGDRASENWHFPVDSHYTCVDDNGHHPLKRRGLCILMKKESRGWDSGLV